MNFCAVSDDHEIKNEEIIQQKILQQKIIDRQVAECHIAVEEFTETAFLSDKKENGLQKILTSKVSREYFQKFLLTESLSDEFKFFSEVDMILNNMSDMRDDDTSKDMISDIYNSYVKPNSPNKENEVLDNIFEYLNSQTIRSNRSSKDDLEQVI